MQIYGFNKTTLLDYPEHVAATVFTGGCNFRCPFCHNGGLVLRPGEQGSFSQEEVLKVLKKRKGILEGICITGGEPTLQPDLREFILKVRQLGYLVKLDTNGYRPKVLQMLLEEKLLDYVAMDVKASRENYALAAGVENLDISRIEESIGILKNAEISYEFRTTVVKGIHSMEEFEAIGSWLTGSRMYYLQGFQENENLLAMQYHGDSGDGISSEATLRNATEEKCKEFAAFSKGEMEQMAEIAGKYIERVYLRGVE